MMTGGAGVVIWAIMGVMMLGMITGGHQEGPPPHRAATTPTPAPPASRPLALIPGRIGPGQDRLTPLQRCLAGGCHLNRPIGRLVADSGLGLTRMDNYYAKDPKPFGYMFEGTAIRA